MRFKDEQEYQDFLAGRKKPDALQEVIAKHGFTKGEPPVKNVGTRHGKPPGPNKTEGEYGRLLALEYPGACIRYEGLTLTMDNGHKYTPDWIVKTTGLLLCVEVKARGKNGFRLPSYQRARLAYDQCRTEWGCFQFRWAEKSGGKWNVE